jgi:hypothetical protein
MKRSFLTFLLLCFIISFTDAQLWKTRRYEATLGIGPSFLFGDIGGSSKGINILGIQNINYKQTRYNFNLNAKYRVLQDLNIRLSITSGIFHASDSKGSNQGRLYESTTMFIEPALIGEYYFIKNRVEGGYLFSKGQQTGLDGIFKSLDFYIFTGIGGCSYSVKGNSTLEAIMTKHGGFTVVIPGGVGTTLVYSNNLNFGLELTGRYAFSNNIDGYTSQYSSSNDVYYFFNFTITYKLKTGPNGLPSFR